MVGLEALLVLYQEAGVKIKKECVVETPEQILSALCLSILLNKVSV